MASQHAGQKKRPPPIEIPPPLPQRAVPGPNAFAIAARARQDAMRGPTGEAGHASRPHTQDGPQTPLSASSDGGNASRLPRSNSTTGKYRESAMTTFANLMEQARGSSPRKSPRKSDHSHSTVTTSSSRHGSTARSRHSGRSYQSAKAGQLALEGLDEENQTLRGELEAQTERRFFKMTGQVPETPTAGAQLSGSLVNTNDLRSNRRDSEMSRKPERETPLKSPKKKIFGVSIPSFRTSASNTPTPLMPAKVAKVLGTSPPGKARKASPHLAGPFAAPRSDTSKSLPGKLYDQYNHHSHGRRLKTGYGGTPRSRARTPSRRSPTKVIEHVEIRMTDEQLAVPFESAMPPTPPQKDTPPEAKYLTELNNLSWIVRGTVAPRRSRQDEDGDFVDTGMKLHIPANPKINPVASHGGLSPKKFVSDGAGEYAKLVEGDRIFSAYGDVQSTNGDDEEEANYSAPLKSQSFEPMETPRLDRWSDSHHMPPRTPLSARLSGRLPLQPLPSTFYTPLNAEVPGDADDRPARKADDRLLFAFSPKPNSSRAPDKSDGGSIGMIFQGEANDIDPNTLTRMMVQSAVEATPTPYNQDGYSGPSLTARLRQELCHTGESPSRDPRKSQEGLQPEPSSSQLTDMLDGVSPSKVEFHEFRAQCPSAMPSPLHRVPDQPHPMLVGRDAPPPMSGLPMGDHFFITNEHIDVVGCTLYDFVASCNKHQMNAVSSKHDQLLSQVEQCFEDIKSQLNAISEKADHTANQNHNISVQLDKLLEFVKTDIVQPVTVQTQKTLEMEQNIQELQKTLGDLQKAMEQKSASPAVYATPQNAPTAFPLPNHRSQPSLVGYYDPHEAGRESASRMPSVVPDKQHVNDNYWPRAPYGRENKDGGHPFSGTNPYNTAAQFGNGFVGGFPQYGFSQNPDPSYRFNQGPPK